MEASSFFRALLTPLLYEENQKDDALTKVSWPEEQGRKQEDRPPQCSLLHSSGSASAPHLGLPLPPALWSIFFIVLIVKVIKEVIGLKDPLSAAEDLNEQKSNKPKCPPDIELATENNPEASLGLNPTRNRSSPCNPIPASLNAFFPLCLFKLLPQSRMTVPISQRPNTVSIKLSWYPKQPHPVLPALLLTFMSDFK